MIVSYRIELASTLLALPPTKAESLQEARADAAALAAKMGVELYFPAVGEGTPFAIGIEEGRPMYKVSETVYKVSETATGDTALIDSPHILYSEARHAARERREAKECFNINACNQARRDAMAKEGAILALACAALGIDPASVCSFSNGGSRGILYTDSEGVSRDCGVKALRYILPGLPDIAFTASKFPGADPGAGFYFHSYKNSPNYPGLHINLRGKPIECLADLGDLIEDIEAGIKKATPEVSGSGA